MPKWVLSYEPSALSLNISFAVLQYQIVATSSGHAFIRVNVAVAWTEPRPASTIVSTNDRAVIVTVIRHDAAPGKRVVITDELQTSRIINAFNHLRVTPPLPRGRERRCPPVSRQTITYQVAFATTAHAAPAVVATLACAVKIVVDGHTEPTFNTLGPTGMTFAHNIAQALGVSGLNFD